MSNLYKAVFEEFLKQLVENEGEIFLFPLPFTMKNKLAMLAATVAEKVVKELESKEAE